MKTQELYDFMQENVAPKALSDEYCAKYGAYDNSGILIDCGREIGKVLFSLDLSAASFDRAEGIGADAVVTHHPAIYSKIGNILCGDPLGKRLQRAVRAGLSVISMHLNFDCAREGIDEWLMRGIGGEAFRGEIQEPLSAPGCGYGRIYDVRPDSAGALAGRIGREFGTERVWCYDPGREVRRVASFCGAGASEGAVMQAVRGGADCIVSADFQHHVVTMALESGLSVIALTHYASEDYGFRKIYGTIKDRLPAESEYFTDGSLL